MSSVFLHDFSAVEKKDSVCCLLFILETVHMRRNLSAATPIHYVHAHKLTFRPGFLSKNALALKFERYI